ncbi:MAG: glycosyltransferase family 39 protein [Acidobacteriota bacterium]|nr:glycosyltransferase family 39 protein [Acidobacteriota bacterium]
MGHSEMGEAANEPVTIESEQAALDSADQHEAAAGNPWLKPAAVICVVLFIAIYWMRLDKVFGMMLDDAWYLVLAKSLATGHGYTLVNSPTPGIVPIYPPAFPFLISLLYRLFPQFPENLWLLKSLSVVVMLVAGWAIYSYLTRERGQSPLLALGIAAASVFCPSLVFLATSAVMSECLFLLCLVLTVMLIERGVQQYQRGLEQNLVRYLLPGSVFAAIAFLTRSAAIAMLAAVVLYLLKKRLIKPAIVFVLIVSAIVGPWIIYSRMHAPTQVQMAEVNSYIVVPYTKQFWQNIAGFEVYGETTAAQLPARTLGKAWEIFGTDFGRMFVAPVFEALTVTQNWIEQTGNAGLILSLLLSLLTIIGFIHAARQDATLAEFVIFFSFLLIVIWPGELFRQVLPFLPFLLFYLVLSVEAIHGFYPGLKALAVLTTRLKVMGALVGVILAINLYGNIAYVIKLSGSMLERPTTIRIFEENEELLKWVRERVPPTSPSDGAIATSNPPLVYMLTGHKTVGSDNPAKYWETWNQLGVRYLVRTQYASRPVANDAAEAAYKTLYRQRGELNLRVVDLGPPSSRSIWGSPPPNPAK